MTPQQKIQEVQAFFAWREGSDISPLVEAIPIPGQLAAYEQHLRSAARERGITEALQLLSEAEWGNPTAARDAIAEACARLEGVL